MLVGGPQASVTRVGRGNPATRRPVTWPGAAHGTRTPPTEEVGPVPIELIAATRNEYLPPLTRPEINREVAGLPVLASATDQAAASRRTSIRYPVIGARPLAGATQDN